VLGVAMSSLKYPPKDSIKRALEYLHSCGYKEYSLEVIAQIANLSPYHFIRVFKAEVGLTPYKYLTKIKVEAIMEKLADKNLSVSEAFSACGVKYNGHFAAVFRKTTGMSPSQYRKELWGN
jgi:AraC family transcriptional regulator